jgi:hypothetical protein
MPDRSSKKQGLLDLNESAARIAAEATGGASEQVGDQPAKDPLAVELGRRGGKKGGKARAAKLTPEQRREIARKAAATRWGNRTEP